MIPSHSDASHAYFHTQKNINLLLESISLDDDKSLVSACIVLFIIAFFQEGIKLMRSKLLHKTRPKQFLNKTCAQRMFSAWHLLQTLLHSVQMFITAIIMLSMMSFHAWIVASIIAGGTFGYLCFGWAHGSITAECD